MVITAPAAVKAVLVNVLVAVVPPVLLHVLVDVPLQDVKVLAVLTVLQLVEELA